MIVTLQEYAAGILSFALLITALFGPLWIGHRFGDDFPEQWKPPRFKIAVALLAWVLASVALYKVLTPSIAILNDYYCRATSDPAQCRLGWLADDDG